MNPEEKRLWSKAWVAKRKAKAFQLLGGVCAVCGDDSDLEIDHVDPKTKDPRLKNHGIPWTWNWDWILAELSKCQLLCKQHHLEKSLRNQEYGTGKPGESNPRARLTEQDVIAIRLSSRPSKELAILYKIHPATVNKIRRGARWNHISASPRTLNGFYA